MDFNLPSETGFRRVNGSFREVSRDFSGNEAYGTVVNYRASRPACLKGEDGRTHIIRTVTVYTGEDGSQQIAAGRYLDGTPRVVIRRPPSEAVGKDRDFGLKPYGKK